MSGPSDRGSPGAEVQSRVVQRLFYCGTGLLRIFPFHTVPNPVAKVNHKTCRTVSAMKCVAVGCQRNSPPGEMLRAPRSPPQDTYPRPSRRQTAPRCQHSAVPSAGC